MSINIIIIIYIKNKHFLYILQIIIINRLFMFIWNFNFLIIYCFFIIEIPILTNVLIKEKEASEVYKYNPILALIPLIYLLLISDKK